MNIERDKFLTEAMGECWHEDVNAFGICGKCQAHNYITYNFSTWEGFGKLWEFVKTQKWWYEKMQDKDFVAFVPHLVNPDKFANKVYEYIKGNNNEI